MCLWRVSCWTSESFTKFSVCSLELGTKGEHLIRGEMADHDDAVDRVDDDNDDDDNDDDDNAPLGEFVNTGLHRWEEIRHRWLTSSSSSMSEQTSSSSSASSTSSRIKTRHHAKDIDIDEVIDLIVSNRWRQQQPPVPSSRNTLTLSSVDVAGGAQTTKRDDACFPSPVSLPQMVDVLVDLWEAEGLDI